MGSCLTRGAHEEPLAAPQDSCVPAVAPEQSSKESCLEASSGTLSGSSTNPSTYHVTALATSSLGGLVQTIKDHVTKPTAMARGRVAHLIEWKGWCAPQTGWEPSLADEECYADLTDELKEACFAAGVAKQLAISEAMLSAWSFLDGEELHYREGMQNAIQLQDLGSLYLQNFLLGPQDMSDLHLADNIQVFSPPSCVSPIPNGHSVANGWSALGGSLEKPPPSGGGQESSPSSLWQPRSSLSLRYVDSSSLSEDEVFYN
ncbi:protein FAM131C isoform X2 [Tiliqua scincoides]|uniref:protein FAM131C isoform X2 n=1 Tax=Tiliqua scincoides TaxID=71010 RepID=UPI00346302E6